MGKKAGKILLILFAVLDTAVFLFSTGTVFTFIPVIGRLSVCKADGLYV